MATRFSFELTAKRVGKSVCTEVIVMVGGAEARSFGIKDRGQCWEDYCMADGKKLIDVGIRMEFSSVLKCWKKDDKKEKQWGV